MQSVLDATPKYRSGTTVPDSRAQHISSRRHGGAALRRSSAPISSASFTGSTTPSLHSRALTWAQAALPWKQTFEADALVSR